MIAIRKMPCRFGMVRFRGIHRRPGLDRQVAVLRERWPVRQRWWRTMHCPHGRSPDNHVKRPGTEGFQNDSFAHRLGLSMFAPNGAARIQRKTLSCHHASEGLAIPHAQSQAVSPVEETAVSLRVATENPCAVSGWPLGRISAMSPGSSSPHLAFAASASAIFWMWAWKSSSSPSSNSGRASRKSFRRHHWRM